MPTTIEGSQGIDKVKAGAIERGDLPAGTVLQVVHGNLDSTTTTTSTTDVSSGLTATITPTSATSKIIVLVNGGKAYIGGGQFMPCTLYRNGSSLGANARYTPVEGSPAATNHSMCLLDSPASTSSQTYTVYFRSSSGATAYFSDTPATTGKVTITLMEIAA